MKRVKGKTDFSPGNERVKLKIVVHWSKWLTFFTGMKKVKLNIVVHGSKWLTFFTGMKRVKGETDFSPGKERVN